MKPERAPRAIERLHTAWGSRGPLACGLRPLAALFQALRTLGYRVDSPNDRLPVVIYGTGPRAGKCRVSIEESSQFASALLMCSVIAGWQIEIVGENSEESPYVLMTREMYSYFYWSRKNSPRREEAAERNRY